MYTLCALLFNLRSYGGRRFAEDGNAIFSSNACDMEFRLLSTKSSVLGDSGEHYLTQCNWYWKQGDNDWREYTRGVSVLFQTIFLIF